MLDSLTRLVSQDIENQAQWARQEAGAHVRSFAWAMVFAFLSALCAFGVIAVALAALFVWAEPRYGTLTALGLVGAVLIAAMLIFVIVCVKGSRTVPVPRPKVQSVDSAQLKAALASDASAAADQAVETLRQSPLGSTINAGEQALKTGEQIVRAFGGLTDKPTPTLLALAAAVVVGTIIGRRV